MEKLVLVIEICYFLCSVYKFFLGLQFVMQELVYIGVFIKEDGEKEMWKVSNKFYFEVNNKEDEKVVKEDSQFGEQND